MRLICLQENLVWGVTNVSRSVASRPQLSVLGNIFLKTDGGRLRLSATNLETGVHLWIGAKVEKEGSFTVPCRVFLEFVSSLPKGKVEISLVEQQLLVKSGAFEATFNGVPASEFPPLPVFGGEGQVEFDSSTFSSAINRVSFAAATDEGRPVLTGVLLSFLKNELSFVATDGYRLSLVSIKNPTGEEKERKVILPARTLSEVVRMIEGRREEEKENKEGGKLVFAFLSSGNQAIFSFPSVQVISQVIGGEYPAYGKIIPSLATTKVVVATEELLKAVKIAAIFARESANIVRFKIEKGILTLSANTPQMGANKSVLEVKSEGEGGEIAFNSRYLLDFLNAVGALEVSFEMTGALSPGVFRPVGDDSYLHIIMPVRIQS